MLERVGNILDMNCDAICVTTNGFVSSKGKAVMGRGIAKQVADLIPDLPYKLGRLINSNGNHVNLIMDMNPAIISFPVKPSNTMFTGNNVVSHVKDKYSIGDTVVGFLAKAEPEIIKRSCIELVQLADNNPDWETILLPRVGCGAGELNWFEVKPILQEYLDDRFVVCTYPVQLPITSEFTSKDQTKADICNKFIGSGFTGTSTEAYRIAYGTEANSSTYDKDIVFISVNGGNKPINLELYLDEIQLAKAGKCYFIMDNTYHTNRPYNTGERLIQEILTELGINMIRENDNFSIWQ